MRAQSQQKEGSGTHSRRQRGWLIQEKRRRRPNAVTVWSSRPRRLPLAVPSTVLHNKSSRRKVAPVRFILWQPSPIAVRRLQWSHTNPRQHLKQNLAQCTPALITRAVGIRIFICWSINASFFLTVPQPY